MKILIIIGFICLISFNMHAATSCRDTIPRETKYKISREQFLDKYGKDDTARTIINYYFVRHKRADMRLISYSLIMAGSVILYATSIVNKAAGVVLIFGSIAVGSALIFGTLLFGSCSDLLKFSRKKLLKTLNNYFSGKGIPSNLKKNLYSKRNHL